MCTRTCVGIVNKFWIFIKTKSPYLHKQAVYIHCIRHYHCHLNEIYLILLWVRCNIWFYQWWPPVTVCTRVKTYKFILHAWYQAWLRLSWPAWSWLNWPAESLLISHLNMVDINRANAWYQCCSRYMYHAEGCQTNYHGWLRLTKHDMHEQRLSTLPPTWWNIKLDQTGWITRDISRSVKNDLSWCIKNEQGPINRQPR